MLALLAQAAPGVTLTPGLLALGGLLVAALSALLAGGVAWGRFDAALTQIRSDHAELRADVKRAAESGAQIAVLQQAVADLRARVELLGTRSHQAASEATRLATLLDALTSRVGEISDDVRHSSHPRS
jgi:hypothetical protein